jgi:hypothetical protein
MNLTLLVLGLSSAGALLFFVAGFAFALARARAVPPAEAPALPPASPELEAERAARASAETTLASTEAARVELQARLDALAPAVRDVEEQRTLNVSLKATIASLHSSVSLTEARAVELQQRVATVTSELSQARQSLAEATEKLSRRDGGQAMQQQELAHARQELERACDEIASLRVEKQRADQAHAARVLLEAELQKLKALQFATNAVGARPLHTVDLAAGRATATTLDELVERVRTQWHYESVAIADELGLAAAGVGPHTDELAAFTSLLLGVSARAARFFPMHDFGYAAVSDANGISIEARPVGGNQGFVLMTLGATHLEETR